MLCLSGFEVFELYSRWVPLNRRDVSKKVMKYLRTNSVPHWAFYFLPSCEDQTNFILNIVVSDRLDEELELSLNSSEKSYGYGVQCLSYYYSIREMSEINDYDYYRGIFHVHIRDLDGSRSKNLLDNSDLAFRSCISMRWCVIDGLRKVYQKDNDYLYLKKENRTIFVVELLILWWTHAQWIWTILLRWSQILWGSEWQ